MTALNDPASAAATERPGEVRLARLDSLRAIAALLVVVAHLLGYAVRFRMDGIVPGVVEPIHRATQPGPFLLFAVSGYVLFLPFARHHLDGGRAIDVRAFARNRALRLLPVYVVMVAVLLLLDGRASRRAWLIYLTFSQNVVAHPDQQINKVLWTLVVELQFCLVLPVLAIGIAAASRGRLGLAAAVVAGLALASMACAMTSGDATTLDAPGWRLSLITLFYFLAVGMLLALLRIALERGSVRLPGIVGSTETWLVCALAVWTVLVVGRISIPEPSAMITIVLVCTLVVGGVVLPLRPGPTARVLDRRPLVAVGLVCYSLYLWHDPVLGLLARSGLPGGLPAFVLTATPLIAVVTLISYRLLEVPSLRRRRPWVRPAQVIADDRPSRPVRPCR